jgi:hypothetical protein
MKMTRAVFEGVGVRAREHEEGQITKLVEQYTSQIPSGFYLGLAIGSIGLSLLYKLRRNNGDALFFGQWVTPFLLMGVYNKLVKLEGSD